MKEENYEAAVAKFAEAAYFNPKSSGYSNNAGFALYQMKKYEAPRCGFTYPATS